VIYDNKTPSTSTKVVQSGGRYSNVLKISSVYCALNAGEKNDPSSAVQIRSTRSTHKEKIHINQGTYHFKRYFSTCQMITTKNDFRNWKTVISRRQLISAVL